MTGLAGAEFWPSKQRLLVDKQKLTGAFLVKQWPSVCQEEWLLPLCPLRSSDGTSSSLSALNCNSAQGSWLPWLQTFFTATLHFQVSLLRLPLRATCSFLKPRLSHLMLFTLHSGHSHHSVKIPQISLLFTYGVIGFRGFNAPSLSFYC